jgi:hypothetical protein
MGGGGKASWNRGGRGICVRLLIKDVFGMNVDRWFKNNIR